MNRISVGRKRGSICYRRRVRWESWPWAGIGFDHKLDVTSCSISQSCKLSGVSNQPENLSVVGRQGLYKVSLASRGEKTRLPVGYCWQQDRLTFLDIFWSTFSQKNLHTLLVCKIQGYITTKELWWLFQGRTEIPLHQKPLPEIFGFHLLGCISSSFFLAPLNKRTYFVRIENALAELLSVAIPTQNGFFNIC